MTIQPYADAIGYLEDELTKYLPARASRIEAERQVKDLSGAHTDEKTVGQKQLVVLLEAERRAHDLNKQEAEIRHEIEARLEATRMAVGEPGFCLDLLNGGLDGEARLILLSLTAMALGMCDQTFAEIGISYYGSASVNDLMILADVKTIQDRLRVRRILLDMTGKELIVLDFPHTSYTPEEFNTVSVSLSRRAFCVILDDFSLGHEGVTPKEETH